MQQQIIQTVIHHNPLAYIISYILDTDEILKNQNFYLSCARILVLPWLLI